MVQGPCKYIATIDCILYNIPDQCFIELSCMDFIEVASGKAFYSDFLRVLQGGCNVVSYQISLLLFCINCPMLLRHLLGVPLWNLQGHHGHVHYIWVDCTCFQLEYTSCEENSNFRIRILGIEPYLHLRRKPHF